MTTPLQIDFFADPTCPWCYVGFHAVQTARQRIGGASVLRWRPFLLRPDAPPEGVDRMAFYASLRARDPERFEASRAALDDAVAALGLKALSGDKPARIPSAMDLQRVLLWAGPRGAQEGLAEELLNRYWRDGADIGDRDLLADTASAAGLERDVVRDLLAGDTDCERILGLHQMALRAGMTGVPVVVRNGAAGVMGAQSVDAYIHFLTAA